jgi:hypothetical protein
MAEPESVKVDVAFKSGQTLSLTVSPAVLAEIEEALLKGEPDSVTFEAEDGRYTVVVRMISFLKRPVRESRVGFGVGG